MENAWEFAAEAVNCEKFSTHTGFGGGRNRSLPDCRTGCYSEKWCNR